MSRLHRVGLWLLLWLPAAAVSAQGWTTFPGAPPTSRAGGAMAFDGARGRCMLHGGAYDEFLYTDETWEFDGVGWTRLFPVSSPPPRSGHALAYDCWRHRLVMWGGMYVWASPMLQNDTWEFDGTAWTQVGTTVRPAARFGAGMAFDARRRRMVLFGGFASGATFGDTWEYDGANWLARTPVTQPAARYNSPLFYDTARNVVAMWGGATIGASVSNDYWEWDGTDWTLVPTTNTPSGRLRYQVVFDAVRGVVVMVCGQPNETWECSSRTRAWTNVQAPLPVTTWFGLVGAMAAFDARRGTSVLLGTTDVLFPAQTFEYAPAPTPTWTPYGFGCAGSAGEPVLSAPPGASPALGSTLPLQVAPLPASSGIVVYSFGFDFAAYQGAPLPQGIAALGAGCELWIEPAGIDFVVPHGGGSATLPLLIPALPAFAGQRFAVQAAVSDPQAPNGIGVVTNAVLARTW